MTVYFLIKSSVFPRYIRCHPPQYTLWESKTPRKSTTLEIQRNFQISGASIFVLRPLQKKNPRKLWNFAALCTAPETERKKNRGKVFYFRIVEPKAHWHCLRLARLVNMTFCSFWFEFFLYSNGSASTLCGFPMLYRWLCEHSLAIQKNKEVKTWSGHDEIAIWKTINFASKTSEIHPKHEKQRQSFHLILCCKFPSCAKLSLFSIIPLFRSN